MFYKYKLANILIILVFILSACHSNSAVEVPTEFIIQGKVQKGPFLEGGICTIHALDSKLKKTEEKKTITIDKQSQFVLQGKFKTHYATIQCTGKYYNENTGENTKKAVTLSGILDLREKSEYNVNVATTLLIPRIKHLYSVGGDFKDITKKANKEIWKIFNLPDNTSVHASNLDLLGYDLADTKLLYLSSVVQQGVSNTDDMNVVMTNIATSMATNGKIDDPKIKENLINKMNNVDLQKVAANLHKFNKDYNLDTGLVNKLQESLLDIDHDGIQDNYDPVITLPTITGAIPNHHYGSKEFILKAKESYSTTNKKSVEVWENNKWNPLEDKSISFSVDTKVRFFVQAPPTLNTKTELSIASSTKNKKYVFSLTTRQKVQDIVIPAIIEAIPNLYYISKEFILKAKENYSTTNEKMIEVLKNNKWQALEEKNISFSTDTKVRFLVKAPSALNTKTELSILSPNEKKKYIFSLTTQKQNQNTDSFFSYYFLHQSKDKILVKEDLADKKHIFKFIPTVNPLDTVSATPRQPVVATNTQVTFKDPNTVFFASAFMLDSSKDMSKITVLMERKHSGEDVFRDLAPGDSVQSGDTVRLLIQPPNQDILSTSESIMFYPILLLNNEKTAIKDLATAFADRGIRESSLRKSSELFFRSSVNYFAAVTRPVAFIAPHWTQIGQLPFVDSNHKQTFLFFKEMEGIKYSVVSNDSIRFQLTPKAGRQESDSEIFHFLNVSVLTEEPAIISHNCMVHKLVSDLKNGLSISPQCGK